DKYDELKSCSISPGDILISLVGTIGQTLLLSNSCQRGIINPRLLRISLNKDRIIPAYIQYILTSNYTQNILKRWAQGGTMGVLNAEMIKTFPILLPPLSEQKKIAAILSTWDRAIEGTKKLLDNSLQQKKALMQQLLTGKKRLPGFTGEWKTHALSELAAMSSGGTPLSTQKDYFGGNIPWVSIADMTRCGKYISQTEKTLTKKGLDNSAARLYPKNTILYAMYASIGECSIASTELSCSQAILGIRTNSKLYFEYLYFYLTFLKEKIKILGQTGTQSNLNAKMVKAFHVNLPLPLEQKAIAAVLTTADEKIAAIESDLSRLRDEKKALMQQLLTGKRRVKVDQEISDTGL
ncbi:MAG: restriction endonuclease subunit S, partial [Acetobacter sp.]|uniref:restriction endonuclease subunit S n=1 Tax=Acetobacter sp. TaxID=440 RepID=UPI0039E7E5AA